MFLFESGNICRKEIGSSERVSGLRKASTAAACFLKTSSHPWCRRGLGFRPTLAAGTPARCSSGLQGLFITPEEMFELKSGLEGRAGSAVAGGNVAFARSVVP